MICPKCGLPVWGTLNGHHCPVSTRYVVHCNICGMGWDERDPDVRYFYTDAVWGCADESACFGRRAAISLELDYRQARGES